MRVAPASMRTSIVEGAGFVELRIPGSRNVFLVIFLLVWLGGWAFGELAVIARLLRGPSLAESAHPSPTAFMVVWLVGWTAGGAYAAYAWVWTVFGREVVRLDGVVLSVSRQPIGIPRRRDFDWQEVRNLRIDRGRIRRWDLQRTPFDGRIAFDYGARTYRLGQGVDEAEAAMLIRELESRFGPRPAE
jgi:hypothetical protein